MVKAALAAGLGLSRVRTAAAQDGDPRALRPQPNDVFVHPPGTREGQVVRAEDLRPGERYTMTYPMDPRTKAVRDGSRLNQVLLARYEPDELAEETRGRAADGIVAYSGVCTHTGCDVWEWPPGAKVIRCPCHFSEFDLRDGARVLNGPAPRRLPALPIKIRDGLVVAAGRFIGRPGFQTEGG